MQALCLQATKNEGTADMRLANQLMKSAEDLGTLQRQSEKTMDEIEVKMTELGKAQDKLSMSLGVSKRSSARLRNSQIEAASLSLQARSSQDML